MKLRPPPILAGIATFAAATALTACGATERPAPPRAPAPEQASAGPSHPAFHGEAARVADTVEALDDALDGGDLLRLCRPGAIFTPAVVEGIAKTGTSCESAVEDLLDSGKQLGIGVAAIELEPRLATAQVSAGSSRKKVPLTLLRDRRRWLISYSEGGDPLSALFG